MKYDDLTIQKLRELAIFDVCSKLGITLYGMGKLTKRAKCWYHDDQHPSMHVNKKKNIYKCFVCGKGGDVIRLVQDYENLSFVEACDWLVHEFSVTVTNTNQTNHSCNSCSKEKSVQSVQSVVENNNSVVENKPVVPLDAALVSKSLGVNSEFCQALVSAGYMNQQQMQLAAERYRLGMTKDGSVIFWEIDQRGHCHNGKLMHYLSNCHRDKSRTPTWAAAELKKTGTLSPDFENPHCLFGLHLLGHTDITDTTDKGRPTGLKIETKIENKNFSNNIPLILSEATRTVCIVESEKTAVICSVVFPSAVWLSCGGLQMFKPELLAPLVAHKVILFPDTDEKGEAYKAWLTVAQQAQKLYPFQYPLRISPLLELHASEDQKRRKIDLVDFIFESV